MRLRKTTIALAVTVSLVATGAGAASAQAAGGCTPTWRLVATPPLPNGTYISPLPETGGSDVASSSGGEVTAVSALTRGSVMFTGAYGAAATSSGGPWFLEGDGRTVTQPKAQAVLPPRAGYGILGTSSFDADTDGWALWSLPTAFTTPFAQRLHGGHWTSVPFAPSPDAAKFNIRIMDVVSISPTDAWAVGSRYPAGAALGLTPPVGSVIEHWDGTRWSVVDDPAAERENVGLSAVAATGSGDIWAVGENRTSGDTQQIAPLVEHWDGTRWTVVDLPLDAPVFFAGLSGISATRNGSVWAIGYTLDKPSSQGGVPEPLVARHDGTSWHLVSAPPDLRGNRPATIYGSSADDAWTVATNPQTGESTFLHWAGGKWVAVPVPGPEEYGLTYQYADIGGTGPADVWAVGSVRNGAYLTDTPQIAHLSCDAGGA